MTLTPLTNGSIAGAFASERATTSVFFKTPNSADFGFSFVDSIKIDFWDINLAHCKSNENSRQLISTNTKLFRNIQINHNSNRNKEKDDNHDGTNLVADRVTIHVLQFKQLIK